MCLGSESGMGVFLFARKVGPTGSVIGLDMSEVCHPLPSFHHDT